MKIVIKILSAVVVVMSALGGLALVGTVLTAKAAPAQAAGAAVAIGLAVIPYCFARGFEMLGGGAQPKA